MNEHRIIKNVMLALFLATALGACTPQVLLTIESEPPGAAVYEGGEMFGVTPVTLKYVGDETFANGGCMGTRPIRVAWDSGAEARVSTISICASESADQSFLFSYPDGYPRQLAMSSGEQGSRSTMAPMERRVAPGGQLLWEVPDTDSDSTLRCYSNVDGKRVVTTCGG